MEKKVSWWRRFLGGIGMGIAAAIPGVSAGAIAVILHVFEPIVYAASNFFRKFKESILVLLPVIIGAILAVIPTIILMHNALNSLLFAVVSLFVGFMIGSFPGMTDEVKDAKPKRKEIIILIICFIVALAIGIISYFCGDKINITGHVTNPEWYMYFVVVLVGIIASAGLIVPGISGSMILLILGFYTPFINNLVEFVKILFHMQEGTLNWNYIGLLVCFAVGVIVGCVLMSKLMKYLLNKNRRLTFFGIIGFMIGSTISLYVNYDMRKYFQTWGCVKWYYEVIIAVVLLIVGIVLAYLLVKAQRKHNKELEENKQ